MCSYVFRRFEHFERFGSCIQTIECAIQMGHSRRFPECPSRILIPVYNSYKLQERPPKTNNKSIQFSSSHLNTLTCSPLVHPFACTPIPLPKNSHKRKQKETLTLKTNQMPRFSLLYIYSPFSLLPFSSLSNPFSLLHITMGPSSHTTTTSNHPSRLKIKKDCHPIQKPASTSSTSSASSSSSNNRNSNNQPLIIYTSSPKVQKLTGLSRANNTTAAHNDTNNGDDNKETTMPVLSFEDSTNSKYNYNNNGNVIGDYSISSSFSLSSNSDTISPPQDAETVLAESTAVMGTELLESSCLLYSELTEMISPGWSHPGFGYGDQQDLF